MSDKLNKLHWDKFSRYEKVYVVLAAIFVTALLIANLMGSMLFSFTLPVTLPVVGNSPLFSAGIIAFPITFILTDLLNEFYGEKGAKFVTYTGFAMSVLVFALLFAGEYLPVDAEQTVIPHEAYKLFSQSYTKMFLASLTAYLIGQLLDIKIFHIFKRVTGGKYLWFRASGSTVVSQLFDSLVVTTVAFYGKLALPVILTIALSNYVWKFIVAVAITPLLYVGQFLIRQSFKLGVES